jgi:CRP/FNR family transcriptional regulator
VSTLKTCLANETIITPGSYIKSVPLIVYGTIKISRVDAEGKEVFLYHITTGQTCAISLNCCMTMRPSEIKAEAEEDTEFLTIPVDYLDDWMTRYKSWKSFMLETYRDRFNDLIRTIDSIAFLKLDERLEKYLNEKVRVLKSRNIEITHQQIAEELNSSREVISRLLKKLEQQNRVKLGRNKLEWLG